MRTQEEIIAEMDAVQASLPELSALTSTSDVSFFGLIKSMFVLLALTLEQRWDQIKADLSTQQAAGQIGSLAWYVNQIKAFQFGDPITVYDGVRVGYETIDPAKQVVTQAAVSETDGRLLVKVAKRIGRLNLGPLSELELTALKDYIRQIKYAGVSVDCVSLPPDEFKIIATMQYDRQIYTASGQYLSEPNQPDYRPLLEAIINYCTALPFNSMLNWTALTDYIQKQPGVIDFKIQQTYTRPNGASAWIEFDRETSVRAGYLALSPESVINYV